MSDRFVNYHPVKSRDVKTLGWGSENVKYTHQCFTQMLNITPNVKYNILYNWSMVVLITYIYAIQTCKTCGDVVCGTLTRDS